VWIIGLLLNHSSLRLRLLLQLGKNICYSLFIMYVLLLNRYGHVSPLSGKYDCKIEISALFSTDIGRIICIIYAIVGVPMTLLLLSIIVRKLLILLNNTYLWFRLKFSSDRRSESKIRFIHLVLVLLFSIIFLFLIPSIIFTYIEDNWSFIDSFYFCFISLTTIGLGDLVAGDSPTQRNRLFYKICLTSMKQSFVFLFFY